MPIDYSRYPPNWKTEMVPTVLKRAENRCEECELENGQAVYAVKFEMKTEEGRYSERSIWFRDHRDAIREAQGKTHRTKTVKVVLTVSHTDHDEENHNLSIHRLRALCQICHLRYDAKEKYRRSLLK